MHHVVGIGLSGCLKQKLAKESWRTPAFLGLKRRSQRLARKIERSSFVPKHVTPASGARCAALRVPAERHGAGSRNHNDSGLAGGCARERYLGIVRDFVFQTADQLARACVLIFRAAAEAETSGSEDNSRPIQSGFEAGFLKTLADRAEEFCPALPGFGVIAGAAVPASDHPAGFVGD